MLRHWVLEASSDGAAWTALRTHANDTSLADQAGSTASWPLAADRAYRHFRVRQTGPNSNVNGMPAAITSS